MSSKAKKMVENLTEGGVQGITHIVPFKVSFNIDGDIRYTVVYVTGVPEGIEDDDPTIKHAAEQMFINALNSRMWLEMYLPEQNSKKDYPHFKNLSRCDKVDVIGVDRIA